MTTTRKGKQLLSLLLAAVMALTLFCHLGVRGYASGGEGERTAVLSSDTEARYTSVKLVYRGSTLTTAGRIYDGKVLVPLYDFVNTFVPVTYERYDAGTRYATLQAEGLTLTVGVGGTFITANDRCLYGVAANRLIAGEVWVPLAPIAKALSLAVSHQGGAANAYLTGTPRALAPASRFYSESEVYWLSRIISAESRGESLRGQMAVGNVVLNRVRSSQFPNTIYSVIFQKGQFSPVMNGTVYSDPAWTSVIAAKMCLEGYSISNDALFFCNLSASTSSWIANNRTYAFALGKHSFYL